MSMDFFDSEDIDMKENNFRLTLISALTALTVVFTLIIRVPVPATNGYVSLIDSAIVFSAIAFGPAPGFLSAAIGSALADVISGYAVWAPISFIVHGLEGLLIGLLCNTRGEIPLFKTAVAFIIALVIVPLGYFLFTGFFLLDFRTSLVEVPGNLVQAGVGSAIGTVLYKAVRHSYPKLDSLRWVSGREMKKAS